MTNVESRCKKTATILKKYPEAILADVGNKDSLLPLLFLDLKKAKTKINRYD